MKKAFFLSFLAVILLSSFSNNKPETFNSPRESLNCNSITNNVLTIKNGGYSAITIEFYVRGNQGWSYLSSYRIPGGSEISFEIGQYESCSMYGYKKSDSQYGGVSSFYSCSTTIY